MASDSVSGNHEKSLAAPPTHVVVWLTQSSRSAGGWFHQTHLRCAPSNNGPGANAVGSRNGERSGSSECSHTRVIVERGLFSLDSEQAADTLNIAVTLKDLRLVVCKQEGYPEVILQVWKVLLASDSTGRIHDDSG